MESETAAPSAPIVTQETAAPPADPAPTDKPAAAVPAAAPAVAAPAEGGAELLDRRVKALKEIGQPLMGAIVSRRAPEAEIDDDMLAAEAELLGKLLGEAARFGQQTLERAPDEIRRPAIAWDAAAAVAPVIAALHRTTGRVLAAPELERLTRAIQTIELPSPPAELRERPPELALFASLAPVISAIARFSFGRDTPVLVGEVAARLKQESIALTRALMPPDYRGAGWASLYRAAAEAVCSVYADSHYAEMDRLLDMNPDERAAYARQYDNKPPMEPVWALFQRQITILRTLAEELTPLELSRRGTSPGTVSGTPAPAEAKTQA